MDAATGYRRDPWMAFAGEGHLQPDLRRPMRANSRTASLRADSARSWPAYRKRPQFIGRFINEYIYKQFPDGVLDELQRVNPVSESGSRSRTHHQHLTEGTGNIHLDRQIVTVVTLMTVSRDANEFKEFFRIRFPGKREVLRVSPTDDGDLVKLFELEDFD